MGIYFFYGDEDYLLEEELKKYRAKLDTNFSSMNYVVHDNPSYPDLIAALRTQPMMFGKLMVVINCEALATGIEAFSNGGGTDGMVKGGFSSTLLLLTISAMIPSATATVHELNEVFASSIGLYLSYIVDAVVLCYLLFALIKGLLGDGNNKALKLVLAIVADVCSVAYLITAILLRDFGVNIGLETRGVAAPICAAVIAQLLLAVVIVGNALYKSEKK